jgi:general secretion pathway protein M
MNFTLPNRFQDFLASLAPRERKLVLLGLMLLLPLGLYLYLWQPLNSERARLTVRVQQLRGEVAQMHIDSEEIKRLRAQAPLRSAQSLEDLARLLAPRFGLPDLKSSLSAQGSDRLMVQLDSVAFDAWIRWLGELGTQGVSLSACQVESLPTPNLVRVKATLVRSAS